MLTGLTQNASGILQDGQYQLAAKLPFIFGLRLQDAAAAQGLDG